MNKMKILLLVVLATCLVEPARILSIIPTLTKSHYFAGRRIILELARRGHEVVSISPYEEKDAPKNFTWIQIEAKSYLDAAPEMSVELTEKLGFIGSQKRLWKFTNLCSKHITSLPKLKHFIENDNSHFDLVLAEEFLQEVFYSFAYKYKAPLVLLSSFGSGHYISNYMGNPLEMSYVPHEFSELSGSLSMWERGHNLFNTIYDLIARRYYSLEFQNSLAREVFKDLKDLPHLEELERNASLILLNSHYSLSLVRPFLPNIVEIGGVHIEDVKPLSKEYKQILDGARQGAIIFSLGSVIELSSLPKEFALEVLKGLGKLDQHVFLRWDSDEPLPLKFKNIYASKWLPQNDLLAHPNTVAFITHGGLHSAQESIYHGVPTICIPFYGDQPLNCKKSVDRGFGILIHNNNVTEENVYNAVKKVVNVPSYKDTARELSSRFKDRPVTPLDSAIFWIEYVLRHKGADFIKGPKRHMYWFQYNFVDVFAILTVSVVIILGVVQRLVGLFYKKAVKEVDKKKRN